MEVSKQVDTVREIWSANFKHKLSEEIDKIVVPIIESLLEKTR